MPGTAPTMEGGAPTTAEVLDETPHYALDPSEPAHEDGADGGVLHKIADALRGGEDR